MDNPDGPGRADKGISFYFRASRLVYLLSGYRLCPADHGLLVTGSTSFDRSMSVLVRACKVCHQMLPLRFQQHPLSGLNVQFFSAWYRRLDGCSAGISVESSRPNICAMLDSGTMPRNHRVRGKMAGRTGDGIGKRAHGFCFQSLLQALSSHL